MSLTSILGLSGVGKGTEKRIDRNSVFNKFIKNRVGTGIFLVASVVIVYLIVTIFTIYNLLISL